MNNYRRNATLNRLRQRFSSHLLFLCCSDIHKPPLRSLSLSQSVFNFKVLKYFIGRIILIIIFQRNTYSYMLT